MPSKSISKDIDSHHYLKYIPFKILFIWKRTTNLGLCVDFQSCMPDTSLVFAENIAGDVAVMVWDIREVITEV